MPALCLKLMPQPRAKKWICRECGRFMPRSEAEALASSQLEPPADGASCSRCGAVRGLFSHTSPEGSDFINNLTFSAYAAGLREAGYEIVLYSAQCNQGDHSHCTGRNELTADSPQDVSPGLALVPNAPRPVEKNRLPHHCFCPCHEKSGVIPLLPRAIGRSFKAGWDSFIKSCLKPIYDVARAAGLTEAEARRVAIEVMLTVVTKFPWKENLDEEKLRDSLQEMTLRQIAAVRENSHRPLENSLPEKKWWQFWK